MRNKRLLSTVVAGALAATTMAMPVMAADQNSVTVDFTTKTPVIRVVAPTSILAAVDPLEMNTSGTQIHSTDFELTNKSEVAVGIDVKSVVTLGSGVTLVDTKAGAIASTDSARSDAWLAVAAETSDGKYIEAADKTAGDLTEADNNVTTFKTESSESSASQTFYLNKGTGDAAYKLMLPVATGGKSAAQYKEELNYAQVYELTEQTYADEAGLLADLATKDVYTGGSTETDGAALTLIPAGTKSLDTTNAFDKDNKKYYTASADNALTATDSAKQITDAKKYVYGEGGEGDDTAFRYIGKLGSGKTSWTDADISQMTITYSIYGLTDDKYAAANLEDQLYKPVTTPATSSIPESVQIPASGDITVSVTVGNDNADLTKLETSAYAGDMLTMGNGYGATYASGTITLGNDIVTFLRGASADDLNAVTFTATFGTGANAYTQTFKFTK